MTVPFGLLTQQAPPRGLLAQQDPSLRGLLQISPATVKRQWSYARAWLCEAIVGREQPKKK